MMDESVFEKSDVQIGHIVKTIFSGNETFEVYDIRTIYSKREGSQLLEFKLNAVGKEELKTAWLYRQQIEPVATEKIAILPGMEARVTQPFHAKGHNFNPGDIFHIKDQAILLYGEWFCHVDSLFAISHFQFVRE